MATHPDQDAMDSIERRRLQLEENVAQLRQSLKHWHTWELEYEMLKEELQNAQSPSSSQMVEIGRKLGGKLVNEKEVEELLGRNQQTQRTSNQVIDMISRRIDYVQQNVTAVGKQLDAAEKKLAGAVVLLEPDMENEEGLPLMDIQEELDEEGNVVSSSVSQPGKAAPEIVEALRKTGLKKSEVGKAEESEGAKSQDLDFPLKSTATGHDLASTRSTSEQPGPSTIQSIPKKSVSFSEDTKPDSSKGLSNLEATGYNDALRDYTFTRGTKVIEVDDDDNEIASYPVIPQDETPEAAALRRQMLQHSLSEVGQVVAEIDLDEPDDDYSDDDIDVDYDSNEESEDEDQYGRSTRREISDDYRQQMVELEKKLNARMLENVGPRPESHPLAKYSDDVRTLVVQKDPSEDESKGTADPLEPKKKGVRFAENLDISPAPQPVQDASRAGAIPTPTMSDTIVERTGEKSESQSSAPAKASKLSRFKNARTLSSSENEETAAQPNPEPEPVTRGPSGRTMANTIVENTPSTTSPQAPDEFDPVLVNREVQTQYHKMRNTFIQQKGGFKPTPEEQKDPLIEEVDGKVKKVSRFRAARMQSDGL